MFFIAVGLFGNRVFAPCDWLALQGGAACTTYGNVGRSVALRGHACCAGGRLFFDGERFSIKMLLTANFILVKLITVNLEEAKLPVKNFYTSSSAMFSSGSYWDVATALSFYSPEVAPTRNLLLLDRSVNEKEPALWRVLSVWAICAGLWGLGNRGQKRRGGGFLAFRFIYRSAFSFS